MLPTVAFRPASRRSFGVRICFPYFIGYFVFSVEVSKISKQAAIVSTYLSSCSSVADEKDGSTSFPFINTLYPETEYGIVAGSGNGWSREMIHG